jgi:Reverse transcriptase (RNA-dependent DNA polymerase)
MSSSGAFAHTPKHDPIELVPIAKRTGGIRLLARLGPADRLAYETLVAAVSPTIEERLAPAVVANRAVPGPGVRLEPWRRARRRFRLVLRRLSRSSPLFVMADIRDCYGSIHPTVVVRTLRKFGCEPEHAQALERLLSSFEDRGVPGLPVGPDPSAVLANAVLARVDGILGLRGLDHVRWVDDVIVGIEHEMQGEHVIDRLTDAAAGLGLRLAEEKTRIVEADEFAPARLSLGERR